MHYNIQSMSKMVPSLKEFGYDIKTQIENGIIGVDNSRAYSREWINNYFKIDGPKPKNRYAKRDQYINDQQVDEVGYILEHKKFLAFAKYLYKQLDESLKDTQFGFWTVDQLNALIDLAHKYNGLTTDNYKLAINFDALSKYIKISPEVSSVQKLETSDLDLNKQYRNNYLDTYRLLGALLGEIKGLEEHLREYEANLALVAKTPAFKISCLVSKLMVFYTVVFAIPKAFNNYIKFGIAKFEQEKFDKAQAAAQAELDAMDPISRYYATHSYTGD